MRSARCRAAHPAGTPAARAGRGRFPSHARSPAAAPVRPRWRSAPGRRRPPPGPAVTDRSDRRQHHSAGEDIQGERAQGSIEDGVRCLIVVGLQRGPKAIRLGIGRAHGGRRRAGCRSRQRRGLGRRDALGDQVAHRTNSLLVGARVEAKPARAPRRLDEAVATLPGANRLGPDPGSPGDLADPDRGRGR